MSSLSFPSPCHHHSSHHHHLSSYLFQAHLNWPSAPVHPSSTPLEERTFFKSANLIALFKFNRCDGCPCPPRFWSRLFSAQEPRTALQGPAPESSCLSPAPLLKLELAVERQAHPGPPAGMPFLAVYTAGKTDSLSRLRSSISSRKGGFPTTASAPFLPTPPWESTVP